MEESRGERIEQEEYRRMEWRNYGKMEHLSFGRIYEQMDKETDEQRMGSTVSWRYGMLKKRLVGDRRVLGANRWRGGKIWERRDERTQRKKEIIETTKIYTVKAT